MMSIFAAKITRALCDSQVIDEDENELYQYGFFILFSHIFFFVVTFSFGMLLNMTWESVLLYFFFTFLRSYAGGIHAKTERGCTILTIIALFSTVAEIRLFEILGSNTIPFFMLVMGCACVLCFSPLDTKEKPLEENERKQYRIVCSVISVLYFLLAIAAYMLSFNNLFYIVSGSTFLEGVLLLQGKMKDIFCRSKAVCRYDIFVKETEDNS